MEIIKTGMDFLLQFDNHLFTMIENYGNWVYVILFLIIFVETGIVLMPFLPGDSLLFVAGTFCAGVVNSQGDAVGLNLWIILSLLIIAAILGDSLNYFFGKTIGLKALSWKVGGRQLVKQKYINQTQVFYEKHGPKTIIIARFIPIVRTVTPFVSGVGKMTYKTFLPFDIFGGILWVGSVTIIGYFLGNVPFVEKNLEKFILGIVFISILPIIIKAVQVKLKK